MTTTQTDNVFIMSPAAAEPEYLSATEFAEKHGVAHRTVKRWLAADELPGAYRDIKNWWRIPSGAVHTPPEVDITPAAQVAVFELPSSGVDALPSFLTVPQAAEILDVSGYTIVQHKDYFDVVPFGRMGALVVPLATIKRIRGV